MAVVATADPWGRMAGSEALVLRLPSLGAQRSWGHPGALLGKGRMCQAQGTSTSRLRPQPHGDTRQGRRGRQVCGDRMWRLVGENTQSPQARLLTDTESTCCVSSAALSSMQMSSDFKLITVLEGGDCIILPPQRKEEAQRAWGTWQGHRASLGPAFPPTAGPRVAVDSHPGSLGLGL